MMEGRRWYFKVEFQASNAFEGVEEAFDGFFVGLVFQPGGEGLAPCCNYGSDGGDESRLVGIVGMEGSPQHAPFRVERDCIAESGGELGCCGREWCVL